MAGKEPPYKGGGYDDKFVYFIKAKPNAVKLDLQSYNENDYNNDIEKLKTFGYEIPSDEKIIATAYKSTPGGKLWYVLMVLSISANNWNTLLRKLG
jgi:predicted nuclease of restriction endonuclease-like (RecB) superfamily